MSLWDSFHSKTGQNKNDKKPTMTENQKETSDRIVNNGNGDKDQNNKKAKEFLKIGKYFTFNRNGHCRRMPYTIVLHICPISPNGAMDSVQ